MLRGSCWRTRPPGLAALRPWACWKRRRNREHARNNRGLKSFSTHRNKRAFPAKQQPHPKEASLALATTHDCSPVKVRDTCELRLPPTSAAVTTTCLYLIGWPCRIGRARRRCFAGKLGSGQAGSNPDIHFPLGFTRMFPSCRELRARGAGNGQATFRRCVDF